MDVERIVLYILAIIAIIFILFFIYYFIRRWLDEKHKKQQQTPWPPASYMEVSGAQCPDYWVNSGSVGGGMHKCVNKFHIPVVKSESALCDNVKCFDDGSNNSKTFRTIRNWDNVTRRRQIRNRCRWRDCCQAKRNVPSSWVGITQTCGF